MTGEKRAITWLHLSDLHQRRPGEIENDRHLFHSKGVLSKLLEDIKTTIDSEKLELDFVAFTGDVAWSAHPEEYHVVEDGQEGAERAADFFDKLLKATGLPKERLFIVPGNHDVDWKAIGEYPALAAGLVETLNDGDAVIDFLVPAGSRQRRELAFGKFRNYEEFLQSYFGDAIPFDENKYFYVRHLDLGRRVAILGLNSAWMCGFSRDNDGNALDHGHLLLGEPQVAAALEEAKSADVRIALMHHPFDWLQDFDRRVVEPMLLKDCHFILRGHQHRADFSQIRNPEGDTLVIPAGACYHRCEYRGDGEYNGYNFVRLDFSAGKGTIFWRYFDARRGRGRWAPDVALFGTRGGRWGFDLSEDLVEPEEPPDPEEEPDGYRPIRIFVAAADDVSQEKERLRQVVRELNNTLGHSKRVVLDVLDWQERVVPRVGVRPLQAVLEQFPITCWDILIVILWYSLGAPCGGKHPVKGRPFYGEVEEVFVRAYNHLKDKGRPLIMTYLCKRPVPMSADALQWQQVKDFSSEFRSGREHPGVVAEYRTPSEFVGKVRQDLTRLLMSGKVS